MPIASSNTHFHSCSLRTGRWSEAGRAYLVTTATYGRRLVFADWRLGRLLVESLRRERERARTLCYVIMPDHLHWLVVLRGGRPLSSVVRNVKCGSSRAIRRSAGIGGSLWQPGFHDRAVRREEDLQSLARYVVANPLRAGLVGRLGDYPLWDAVWL